MPRRGSKGPRPGLPCGAFSISAASPPALDAPPGPAEWEPPPLSHPPGILSAFQLSLTLPPPGDFRDWRTKARGDSWAPKVLVPPLRRTGPFLREAPLEAHLVQPLRHTGPFLQAAPWPGDAPTGKTWPRLSEWLRRPWGRRVIIQPVITDQLGGRTSSQLKDKLCGYTFVPVPGASGARAHPRP